MDNYQIVSRDKSKSYTVPYRGYNSETPIIMHGKNSSGYGRDLNQNLLNLLNHYANDKADPRNIEGQLWFDSKNKVLNLKDNLGYVKLGYTRPPIVPEDAIKEFDVNMKLLNYLPVDGGTLSGTLFLKTTDKDNDSENSAVNKNYVDSYKPAIPLGYIPLSGNLHRATGKIYLPNVLPDQDLQAAPKIYADKNIPCLKNSENLKITSTSNANFVEHKPYGLMYIFGESYIPVDNITTTVGFQSYGNIKAYQVQISILNNTNPDITVDAIYKINNGEGELTIIRHNTNSPEAITVHYIITGVKV